MNYVWWGCQAFALLYLHALFLLGTLGRSVIALPLLLAYLIRSKHYEVRQYRHTVCDLPDGVDMPARTFDVTAESAAREPFALDDTDVSARDAATFSRALPPLSLTSYETRLLTDTAVTWPLPSRFLLWTSLVLSGAQLLCMIVLRCYYHGDDEQHRTTASLRQDSEGTVPTVLSWRSAALASIAARPTGPVATTVLTALLLALVISLCGGVLLWRCRAEVGMLCPLRRHAPPRRGWGERFLLAALLALATALLPSFDAVLFFCLYFVNVALCGTRRTGSVALGHTTCILGIVWLALQLLWCVPLVRRALEAGRVDFAHLPWLLRHCSIAVGGGMDLSADDWLVALKHSGVRRCRWGQLVAVFYSVLITRVARPGGERHGAFLPASRTTTTRTTMAMAARGCATRCVRRIARCVSHLGQYRWLRQHAVNALVLAQIIVALLVLDVYALVLLISSLAYFLVPHSLYRHVCSPGLYVVQGMVLLAEYISLQLHALQAPLLMSYPPTAPLGSARLVALLLAELAALGLTCVARLSCTTVPHTTSDMIIDKAQQSQSIMSTPCILPAMGGTALQGTLYERFHSVCDPTTGIVPRERFAALVRLLLPAAYIQHTLHPTSTSTLASHSVTPRVDDEAVMDQLYNNSVCTKGGPCEECARGDEDTMPVPSSHTRCHMGDEAAGNALPQSIASPTSHSTGITFADFVTLADAVQGYRARHRTNRIATVFALLRYYVHSLRYTATLLVLLIAATMTTRTMSVLNMVYLLVALLLLWLPRSSLRMRGVLWRGVIGYAVTHVLLLSALTAYSRVYVLPTHAVQVLQLVGAPGDQPPLTLIGYVVVILVAHRELNWLAKRQARTTVRESVSAIERILQHCEWRACHRSHAARALRHTFYRSLLIALCLFMVLIPPGSLSILTVLYGLLVLLYAMLRAKAGRGGMVVVLGMYAAVGLLWTALLQFPAVQRGVLRGLAHSSLCAPRPSLTVPGTESASNGSGGVGQARLQWCAVQLGVALPTVPGVWPLLWLLPWYASCVLCTALYREDVEEEEVSALASPLTQGDVIDCVPCGCGTRTRAQPPASADGASPASVLARDLTEMPPMMDLMDVKDGLYLLGRPAVLHMRLVLCCHRVLHALVLLYKVLDDWLVCATMLYAAFVPPSGIGYAILILRLVDIKGRPALALVTVLVLTRYLSTLVPLAPFTASSPRVRCLLGLQSEYPLMPLFLLILALTLFVLIRPSSSDARNNGEVEDETQPIVLEQQIQERLISPLLSIAGIYAIIRRNVRVLLCFATCAMAIIICTSLVVKGILLVHLLLLYLFLWLDLSHNRVVAWLLDLLLALELLALYVLYLLCIMHALPTASQSADLVVSDDASYGDETKAMPWAMRQFIQYVLSVSPADLILLCIIHYFQRRLRLSLSASPDRKGRLCDCEERRCHDEEVTQEGHTEHVCLVHTATGLCATSGILCLMQPFFILTVIMNVALCSVLGWLLTAVVLGLLAFPHWLARHFRGVHLGLSLALLVLVVYFTLVSHLPVVHKLLTDLSEREMITCRVLILLGLYDPAGGTYLIWALTCAIGALPALICQNPNFRSTLITAIAEEARQAPRRKARLIHWLREKQRCQAARLAAERHKLRYELEQWRVRRGLYEHTPLPTRVRGTHDGSAAPPSRGDVLPLEAASAGGEDVAATGLRLPSHRRVPSEPSPEEVTVQVATPPATPRPHTPSLGTRAPKRGPLALLHYLVQHLTLFLYKHTDAPAVLPDASVGRWAAFGTVLARFIQSKLIYVCYAAFVLRFVLGDTALDALLSLSALLYALPIAPWPSLRYWHLALFYAAALMMLKYAAYLVLLRFRPSDTARLVIRILLARYTSEEDVFDYWPVPSSYVTRFSWAVWLDLTSTFVVFMFVLCQRQLCVVIDGDTGAASPCNQPTASDDADGGTPAAAPRVGRWRDELAPPHSGTGADYYAVQFACDAAALPLLAVIYFRVTGNVGSDAIESVRLNLLPGPLVLLMLGYTAMLVLERVAYVRRSRWLKWVLHTCAALACHVPLGLWLHLAPDAAARTRLMTTDTIALVYLLLALRLIALWLSALQLCAGYAACRRYDAFTAKTDTLHWLGYTILRALPFLTELRILLDWSLSRTTLKVQHWFLLDGVHDALYKRYVDMHDLSRTSTRRGQPFPRLVKLYQGGFGCLAIVLLLFFPLYYYSSFSPQMGHSGVARWSIELSLSSGGPIFTAVAQDMTRVDAPAGGVMLAKAAGSGGVQECLRQGVWAEIPSARQEGFGLQSTIQVLQWPQCSAQMWSISPPAIHELLVSMDAILDSARTMTAETPTSFTITTTHTITRTSRTSKKGTPITAVSSAVAPEVKVMHQYHVPLASVHALRRELARLAPCFSESCKTSDTALSEGDEGNATSWIALPHFIQPYARFLPLEFYFMTYSEADCDLKLHRAPVARSAAGNYTQPGALYWCVQCAMPQAYRSPTTTGTQQASAGTKNSDSDADSNGTLYAVVSTLDILLSASGLLALLPNIGIIALYTTFVIAIGNLVRGAVTGDVYRVPLLQLANPEPVAKLLRDIYAARAFAAEGHLEDLVLEQQLFLELIDLLRTSDRLIDVSGRRVDDYDADGQYAQRLRVVCEHPF